jgi:hypothetical protein
MEIELQAHIRQHLEWKVQQGRHGASELCREPFT